MEMFFPVTPNDPMAKCVPMILGSAYLESLLNKGRMFFIRGHTKFYLNWKLSLLLPCHFELLISVNQ